MFQNNKGFKYACINFKYACIQIYLCARILYIISSSAAIHKKIKNKFDNKYQKNDHIQNKNPLQND